MTFSLLHSIAVSQRVTWTLIESSLRGLALAPPWMQLPGRPSQGTGTTQQERIRFTLWRLRRAYEEATAGGFPEDLADHIEDLIDRSKEFKQTLILWVDFVEVLIQDAEKRYGRTPGQGQLKARMVKSAIVHVVLRNPKFDIPRIPRILEPSIVDIVADITIDWVVLLLNRHDAWQSSPPVPSLLSKLWARVAQILLVPFNWLVNLLERLLLFIVLKKNALSPEVEAAVVKLAATECPDAQKFLQTAIGFMKWAYEQREHFDALFELIALAVEEAETFIEKTGKEKKKYVTDLILVFLDDVGIITLNQGVLYYLAEGFLDGAIDSVVFLYNKREVFD